MGEQRSTDSDSVHLHQYGQETQSVICLAGESNAYQVGTVTPFAIASDSSSHKQQGAAGIASTAAAHGVTWIGSKLCPEGNGWDATVCHGGFWTIALAASIAAQTTVKGP